MEHGFLNGRNMKRKTIIIFCITFCIGLIAISLNFNKNADEIDMSLLNIEALANGEGDHPTIDCPNGSVLCATVNAPTGSFKYYKQ
jgi:hypothetical protein